MRYKVLGKTGVRVSELCMGTMTFGQEADEKGCADLYGACREAGINHFDCADMYADGVSETILGKLIKKERDQLIITSKAYFPVGKEINQRGLSRRHLRRSVEQSLKRLDTDRIDIFYFHHFDEHTDLEDSLRAAHEMICEGKILYLGASNFAAWQVMKGLKISAVESLHHFSCIQPMYNLLKRQAEVELLPMALEERLGVFSFSPLAAGLLTGKYATPATDTASRLFVNKRYQLRYADPQLKETANRFATFAQARGFDPSALAIAWAASHPAVTSPILGARSVHQLQNSLNGLKIPMTEELRTEISALAPSPPHPTDRDEERSTDH